MPERPDALTEALANLHHQPADDWRDRAACRGLPPSLFFVEIGQTPKHGRRVCDACPVRLDCAIANAHERIGLWGGLTERQLRVLRAAMRDAGIETHGPPPIFDDVRRW